MFTSMSEWISHIQQNRNIRVKFITPILSTVRKSKSAVNNTPIPTVTNPVKTAYTMRRKISNVEIRRLGRASGNGNKHI